MTRGIATRPDHLQMWGFPSYLILISANQILIPHPNKKNNQTTEERVVLILLTKPTLTWGDGFYPIPVPCLPCEFMMGRSILNWMKRGIMQFMILSPLSTVLAIILTYYGLYSEGSLSPAGVTIPFLRKVPCRYSLDWIFSILGLSLHRRVVEHIRYHLSLFPLLILSRRTPRSCHVQPYTQIYLLESHHRHFYLVIHLYPFFSFYSLLFLSLSSFSLSLLFSLVVSNQLIN